MAVQFKLTKPNGLTRRITFLTRPTWPLLSARIANLYSIAIENVGVSYFDSDGDEVTLSSDDELQDFYTSVPVAVDGAIKLAVHDLSSLRGTDIASRPRPSATPQQSSFRNTFGGHEVLPLVFDAEDEWQRLPGPLGSLFLSRDTPESPHAFVEVLESDVSLSKPAVESEGGDASRSNLTFTPAAFHIKDKGKGRAATVEDDVSSAGSVIGNETPAKPPVHVFDMNSDISVLSPKSTVQLPRSGAATPAQAQSTPVIIEQPLEVDVSVSTEEQRTEVLDDDPPLPSLDSSDPDRAPPSLVHDIATLLTTISTVVGTHPELSECLRNIVVNATNGTYWAAHRDAISRAAEHIHRTALQETGRSLEEVRHVTEQEAGARVTEALGTIFRTVGEFVQDGRNTESQASRNAPHVSPNETTSDIPRPSSMAPTPPRFPQLPPHPRANHHSWFSHAPFTPPGSPFWRGLPHPPPPPPPPPPPLRPITPRGWPRPAPRFWVRDSEHPEATINRHDARSAAAEVLATAAEARARAAAERAQTTAVQLSPTPKHTPEELRAEVETAKADYKARKERYRQAKAIRKMAEQRRHDQASTTESHSISRQTSDNPTQVTSDNDGPTAIPIPTPEHQVPESTAATSEIHIVSNARGPYPQLEMFSVPRRSHPTGHMHRGHVHENKENRPYYRIMRKLSDMGFTEGTYPNLTGKVMDQLLARPPVTKDAEDDIVTYLIEELIPSGGGAQAGGSGGIPGAWH